MMDIVERLRYQLSLMTTLDEEHECMADALQEIERLRAGPASAVLAERETLEAVVRLLEEVDAESPWRSWSKPKLTAWEDVRRLVDRSKETTR